MIPSTWPPAPSLLAPLAPWFDAGRRDLPWRAQDLNQLHPDPYAVLVSELMLQQTQVATVIPYFERWMVRFPDPETLAAASEDEVHKAWEGLGYYRRARNLQMAARIIAETGWPADLEGLLELPGLGPYTGAAVASIAFQWPEAALDGNAFRVLARLLALEGDPKTQGAALRHWLRPALYEHGPSRLTQALMELGATVCGASPRCEACPVALEPVPKPPRAALGAPGGSQQERRDEHSGSTRFEPDAAGCRPPPQPGGTTPGGRSAASAPLNDEPHRPAGPSFSVSPEAIRETKGNMRSIPPDVVAARGGFGTGSLGCQAREHGLQGVIPPPAKRAAPKRLALKLLAMEWEGRFLVHPPSGKGLLAGLWTWPTLVKDPNPDLAAEDPTAYGVEARTWPSWIQVYTHRREEVEPFHLKFESPFEPPANTVWVPHKDLDALPMGNRDARLRALLT